MDLPSVELFADSSDDEELVPLFLPPLLGLPSVFMENDDITENLLAIIQQDQIDEIIHQEQEEKHRVKIKVDDYIEGVVSNYNDIDFIMHFRLSRRVVDDLIGQFSNSHIFTSLENVKGRQKLNAQKHVLSFLWFVGHQTSSYRDVADRFGITISTLFDLISRVSEFIVDLGPQMIRYPTEEEKRATAYFYDQQLPGVIGSIGGSHIRIDKPNGDPDSYKNKKKYYSIQLQGTVSQDMHFMDVFIGYPGSVDVDEVFQNSPLFGNLHELCGDDYIILGSSEYPCLKELMVPYEDNGHLTRHQIDFNSRLNSCRVTVKNAFGCLKQRFRQLHHLKLRNLERLVQVVYCCIVLHNMANVEDLDFLEPPADDIYHYEHSNIRNIENEDAMEVIRENGFLKRNELCSLIN